MKRIDYITRVLLATFLGGVLPSSCIYDDGSDDPRSATICVNTLAVDGTRASSVGGDNTFMVLFWLQTEHLSLISSENSFEWQSPYLAGHAPQPVSFYKNSVFDTRFPYPAPEDTYIYATGYAPGNVLNPDTVQGYRKLTATVGDTEKGRYDFLGCDFWSEVFKGSLKDPFAQDKNKLYFRHLTAKLVFYADRDKETMENKQYVRNVQVKNLQMSIDDGKNWKPMYTPRVFEWKELFPETDFTESYKKTIATIKSIEGNITTDPKAGYKAVAAEPFAGEGSNYVLQRNATDRVPIDGMTIDSCYVCNPIEDGRVQTNKAIRLKMDIRAEMSFDPNFPMNDGDGSTTDNLTFTREWKGVMLDSIHQVKIGADGKLQTTNTAIKEFKPGNEYCIYLHFHRTGVNLVAKELDWNYGGLHYITILGDNTQTDDKNKKRTLYEQDI